MTEADLMRLIMLELSKAGARVFRNNSGQGWMGQIVRDYYQESDRFITIKNPRPLHAGLCVGSSDLIGWTSRGQFLAPEIKSRTGRLTAEQLNFINAVRASGGIAGVCRSVEEALNLLKGESHDRT